MKILENGHLWKGEGGGRYHCFSLGALQTFFQVIAFIVILEIFKVYELTNEGKKIDSGESDKDKIIKYLLHHREIKKNIGYLDAKKNKSGKREENMKINCSFFSTLMKTKILGKNRSRKLFPSLSSF